MLELSSKADAGWVHELNLDNGLIIDTDENRIATNIDLIAPRLAWRVITPFPARPSNAVKADLEIAADVLLQEFIDIGVDACTNQERSSLLIVVGGDTSFEHSAELSEQCVALVRGSALVGFYVWGLLSD